MAAVAVVLNIRSPVALKAAEDATRPVGGMPHDNAENHLTRVQGAINGIDNEGRGEGRGRFIAEKGHEPGFGAHGRSRQG